ncbi:uncharacterized protein PGTG_09103 [Puccinia graminis f. sp. tritici CRL 75-36-700-3]|uniref:Uncharacterized protein n=1 Tax=Puccinia graminis f. sp. tritici (strain CRL 75-36-700-3 / race SCCL) TaxID=418459 RepID=E3KG36_PUCGT|nr:uncharacterized protein PGTG_09103 [Puccinia graminis f. sp. tritici CRL 75-36-700-3]EFP83150.1 hypothetical protein PGTG_09103 [Puccinia graminis f. sp. tritici CRL 75-36-700-3]
MTLFPKSQRFPPQKASEVPSPGRYNPLLHDPSQDPWRKGPLEIFKAPRNKESDPGPDTFGLYNPDQQHYDNIHGSRPRPRALSTLATPSKHHKELLRLETKLSERESDITHLTETLQKSEQTTKEIRNALKKSEHDNESLRSEVSRLKKQLHGVASLHAKVIELETEHDKSKKRREQEISSLKTELRSAETRASQYMTEKQNIQGDFERLQASYEDAEHSLQTTVQKSHQGLTNYLQKVLEERHSSQRALQLTKSLSRLDDVHTSKILAGRASQVAELVSLVQQAGTREDLLYEVFDNLLETNDMQMQQLIDIEMDLQSERDELKQSIHELRRDSKCSQQLSDQQLCEKEIECQLAHRRASQIQTELLDAQLVCSSLEKALVSSSDAYSDLSGVCLSKCQELEKSRLDLEKCDSKISELTNSIQALEAQALETDLQIQRSQETHSLAAEAWQLKQSELQSSIKKLEKELREENGRRTKLSAELLLTRQAEAALRGEIEHAQNLSAQLEEVERENEQLRKINDLIMRQANLNAAEAAKVEKLNTELVSQRNPAQKVKILDRMRREIKEERENTAKLENQLWTANSEIKSLKEELFAYQSVSHPTPAIATTQASTIHNGMGIARVTRAPLSEVIKNFDAPPEPRETGSKIEKEAAAIRPTPKITTRAKGKHQPSNHFATPPDFVKDIPAEPTQEINQPRFSRLPINSNNLHHQKVLRKKDDLRKEKLMVIHKPQVDNTKNSNNTNVGEVSLGAIKMQGKMTLEELR